MNAATLPTKTDVLKVFANASIPVDRITLRNNQYIVTVSFTYHFKACEVAATFGISNTASKHQFVKIK